MLDCAVIANKKYYLQTFLEECKYEIKKNKMENFINDDFVSSSSDESGNGSDNESDNESDSEYDIESDNECDNESDNESKNLRVIND